MYETNQGSSCWFLGDLEDLAGSWSHVPKYPTSVNTFCHACGECRARSS
ncbi:hypothetical protein [Allorhizobium sonneratiae]